MSILQLLHLHTKCRIFSVLSIQSWVSSSLESHHWAWSSLHVSINRVSPPEEVTNYSWQSLTVFWTCPTVNPFISYQWKTTCYYRWVGHPRPSGIPGLNHVTKKKKTNKQTKTKKKNQVTGLWFAFKIREMVQSGIQESGRVRNGLVFSQCGHFFFFSF